MNSSQVQDRSCFSYFESSNSCLQSKWFIVALAISSFVFLGAAVFGGIGLFTSQLPQWLAHAVGTVGHSGCLAMLMWGTVLGGIFAVTAIVLMVKRCGDLSIHHSERPRIPNLEARETEAIPSDEESIETLNTRLLAAARDGQIQEITPLLNRGANIETMNEHGWSPLSYAAYEGHVDLVRILLERGANIETTTGVRLTPLTLAAAQGYVDVVRTLLDHGANIEARDQLERTPLMHAAREGQTDVVRAFLYRQANIEAVDQHGQTPLMWAATQSHTDTMVILLAHGASLLATDHAGRTVLDHIRTPGFIRHFD